MTLRPLLLLLLAATCHAAPPNGAALDAHKWLKTGLHRTELDRAGGKDFDSFAQGTLYTPPRTWLEVRARLVIPYRHAIVGDSYHQQNWPGFIAAADLDWMLVVDLARDNPVNSNSNFDQDLRRVAFHCEDRAGGVYWRGAQGTTIEDVMVWRTNATAFHLAHGSTGVDIRSLDIRNGNPNKNQDDDGDGIPDNRFGNGLVMHGCHQVSVTALSVHCVKRGLDLTDSHSVDIRGVRFEKVDHLNAGCSSNTIAGIDWQWCGKTPFDFTGDQGGNVVSGRIRDSAVTHYLDRDGVLRPFEAGLWRTAGTARGTAFVLKTTWKQGKWHLEATTAN